MVTEGGCSSLKEEITSAMAVGYRTMCEMKRATYKRNRTRIVYAMNAAASGIARTIEGLLSLSERIQILSHKLWRRIGLQDLATVVTIRQTTLTSSRNDSLCYRLTLAAMFPRSSETDIEETIMKPALTAILVMDRIVRAPSSA